MIEGHYPKVAGYFFLDNKVAGYGTYQGKFFDILRFFVIWWLGAVCILLAVELGDWVLGGNNVFRHVIVKIVFQ